MNVMDLLDQQEADAKTVSELPQRFICPFPSTGAIPDDGVFAYQTVESLADLLHPGTSATVYMFDAKNEKLLECLVEYFDLFGYAPVILTGVPDVAYNPKFETITWALNRAAYHATVNDILEFKRKAELSAAEVQQSTIYGREQARITRKNGTKKEFTAFDMPQMGGELDPVEAAETAP